MALRESSSVTVDPEFLSSHQDVLTVVTRQSQKDQSRTSLSDSSGGLRCYKSVAKGDGKDFIQSWKLNSDKKGFRAEVRAKSAGQPEVEIVMLNAKGQIVSDCALKKVPAEEALSVFLAERIQDKKTIHELQSTLKKLTVEKNLMEDSMYRAFAKCLNSKKEKIRELQEQLDVSGGKTPAVGLHARSANVKAKAPTRRSKRTRAFKNLDSNPESEEDSQESPIPKPMNSTTIVKENEPLDLYNDDTDTDDDDGVPGPSTAAKPSNRPVIVSSSGSETDFDGDVAMLPNNMNATKKGTSHSQNLATTTTNLQTNEANNNLEGPSPSKQAKAEDSDPMSKYDKDLLLEDL